MDTHCGNGIRIVNPARVLRIVMVVSSVTLLSGLCLVNDETDYDSPRCAVSMRTNYCNFGVNPDYVSLLKQELLRILGADAKVKSVSTSILVTLFLSRCCLFLSSVQPDKERILCDAFYEGRPGAHECLVQQLSWSLSASNGSQQRQRSCVMTVSRYDLQCGHELTLRDETDDGCGTVL